MPSRFALEQDETRRLDCVRTNRHGETLVIPPHGVYWHVLTVPHNGVAHLACSREVKIDQVVGTAQVLDALLIKRLCCYCRNRVARGD